MAKASENISVEMNLSEVALRLKALIENAIDGIVVIDEKGIIESVNPAAAKLFGFAPDEIIGNNVNVLMPNPYHDEHDRYLSNYLKTGNAKIIGVGREVKGKKKDGTIFPLRLAVSEIKLSERTIFTGFVHDLTDQKAAEEALKREKETAQSYLDVANTIILVLNKEGKIELVNRKGAELLECEVEGVVGSDWFDRFIPEHEWKRVKEVFDRMVHQREVVEYYENEVVTKNGQSLLIGWRNSLYYDSDGEILGTISSGVDITEQRLAENKIKQLNERLEAKVRERTNDLAKTISQLLTTNDQLEREIQERKATSEALRESEKQLKRALIKERELGELKSRFLSMASHEFRTPLASILASAELIEAYNNDEHPKISRSTKRILSSVKNLMDILNDFLSLSKLEEGKIRVNPEQFDFLVFLEDLLEEVHMILKKNQEIVVHGNQDPLWLYTDPKILKNILLNLFSNASKYSKEGQTIDCRIDAGKKVLQLDITDYGIGIPEEDQQYLFTRFYRATNVESIQGTGLGLSIVKRYIDLLGGKISFNSILGKGTTFTITIPFRFAPTKTSTL